MSRVQLALNVADIDEAIDFYSKLFATEPAKVRPGYANFASGRPAAEAGPHRGRQPDPGTLNHLGVEVPTTDEVSAAQARLAGEGLATALEEETSCCYAVQDKVWVDGPGGEPWEIYTVLSDTEMPAGQLRSAAPGESACCSTRARDGRMPQRARPRAADRPTPHQRRSRVSEVASEQLTGRGGARRAGRSPACRSSTGSCRSGSSWRWRSASCSGGPSPASTPTSTRSR